jgi:MFS family permease
LTSFGYPVNYAWMFFLGASLLLTASCGFWMIKEIVPSSLKIRGLKDFLKLMKSELSENRRLVYFLGFINTQGVIISFLPFVMLYAKETFHTSSSDTGYFLLYKVMGIVGVSMLVFAFSRKITYKPLLYLNVCLSVALILATLLVDDDFMLRYVFILGGISYSLYMITMDGLLLEISTTRNRALYTGFTGAGNLLPAVFPLAGGWIMHHLGFKVMSTILILVIISSVYLIAKIDCKK